MTVSVREMHPSKVSPNVAVIQGINPNYTGFDYISWYVGNARQAATYFVVHFGFRVIAYRGPETGSYLISSYVVSNGSARFLLTAPITGPDNTSEKRASDEDRKVLNEIHAHLKEHGDGVKDIAFQVDDVNGVWEHAVNNGAASILKPTLLQDEKYGSVLCATIKTYGDTAHSLINRSGYMGAFLPGFRPAADLERLNEQLPNVNLIEIDHCVGNQPWNGLDSTVK